MITPRGGKLRRSSNNENREPVGSGFGIPIPPPPPGYVVGTLVDMRSPGGQQGQPDIRNLAQFPNLGEPRYLTIRIN